MTEVYEIIDSTNDEMFYPLGIFLSLEDAKEAILKHENAGEQISEFAEEYEEIKIIERNVGWYGNGKTVVTLKREEYYDEKTDEYLWRTHHED